MYIEKISLKYYRNYIQQSIEFSSDINIFLGENAQGKTNLMESIYVLALTKSHRTNYDKELIFWDESFTKLTGDIVKNNRNIQLNLIIHEKGKKALIGSVEQKKLSHYIGQLNVVLFAPEDLYIVKGSPNIRRKFIDIDLGQMNIIYLSYLTAYKKLVKQRNSYLKEYKIDPVFLDILTEQLAQYAAHVLFHRLKFIKKIEQYAGVITKNISQQKDELSIVYKSHIDYTLEDTVDVLYEKYMTLFNQNKKKELEKRTTLYGPHRDDMQLFINGKDVQIYGSQGQQRTVVLSLKLAEIELMKDMTGDYPILLLDDVLSELDDNRQTFLLKSIEGKVQTFITTTNISGIKKHIIKEPKIFDIKEGSISLHE